MSDVQALAAAAVRGRMSALTKLGLGSAVTDAGVDALIGAAAGFVNLEQLLLSDSSATITTLGAARLQLACRCLKFRHLETVDLTDWHTAAPKLLATLSTTLDACASRSSCLTCSGAMHRRIRKSRQRFGRKWLGTTTSATEAAGCVLWEEHGNVEYNAKTEQPVCNMRGTTCLCKGSDGREVHIIGMPNNGKGVEGRELQAGSSSPAA